MSSTRRGLGTYGENADKADPFIRKRLLDLAGNYDA